ncbi:MAG TPA: PIG-L deacetylase family protein [Acidothermaceae bacterium]|jgi:LmbE family N-acetylglucosaminyl deacetylase
MNVLAIGSHPDDIELGCGGALLQHVAAGDKVTMLVMTTGERGPQDAIPRVHEQEDAAASIGADLVWGGYPDGAIPSGRETVAFIDSVIEQTGAAVLYTHSQNDTHQDHVATALASLSAARRLNRVLCYQSPTATSFNPVVYVDIEACVERKIAALSCHRSQVERCELVDLEAIEAGARFWGHHARMRYAEAFEVPRFVWDIARGAAAVHRVEKPQVAAVRLPLVAGIRQ